MTSTLRTRLRSLSHVKNMYDRKIIDDMPPIIILKPLM